MSLLPFSNATARSDQAAKAAMFAVEGDLIKLSNAHYEIAFTTENGGIAYILDKATNKNVSEGSTDLWAATTENEAQLTSSASKFEYKWDAGTNILTLNYTGAANVIITIKGSDSQWLTMQATVTNTAEQHIRQFDLPHNLKVATADIQDALLPMMPGALLSAKFFEKRGNFVAPYPGVLFADYIALRSSQGNLAVYGQHGEYVQPSLVGFDHEDGEDGTTRLAHNYKTWIAQSGKWTSPQVILRVGQDYPDTIAGYRTDNKLDQYKSLTEKLGDRAQVYFAAPMYKFDFVVLGKKFNDAKSAIIDKINIPGMVHFVAFQKRGHDNNYPEFIPPDPRWGSTEEFASLVSYLKSKGNLAVPYTNFSWWDNEGPTLTSLPGEMTINDVVVRDETGFPKLETYASRAGFVVNLHHDLVKDKIAEQHDILIKTLGMDGIFEDQWGARPAPYDFNEAGLDKYDPSISYFQGIVNHYKTHVSHNLFTEVGIDVLAEQAIGFMGTNLLWDIIGVRGATGSYTTYYPMAGMLLRDKVLLYQHDLAAETWTKNTDMLRWNLEQGYSLSNAFLDSSLGKLNMDNPWLNLVGVFQRYALSNYADELVTGHDDLDDGVRSTIFSTYKVYANWNLEKPYTVNEHTVPPGGTVTLANDGSVTAGVFTAYNGQPLSEGDHYIVEVRYSNDVKVFQPVGTETTIHIKIAGDAKPTVTAYRYDDTPIEAVDATVTNGFASFTYAPSIDGQVVGYYKIEQD